MQHLVGIDERAGIPLEEVALSSARSAIYPDYSGTSQFAYTSHHHYLFSGDGVVPQFVPDPYSFHELVTTDLFQDVVDFLEDRDSLLFWIHCDLIWGRFVIREQPVLSWKLHEGFRSTMPNEKEN